MAFVPLFMYCNIDHKNLSTVFNHDAYYIVIMTFFGLSNGYLATLCMIYGPGSVMQGDGILSRRMVGFRE